MFCIYPFPLPDRATTPARMLASISGPLQESGLLRSVVMIWIRRILTVLGLFMIGEGLVAMIHPRRYVSLWRMGPKPCRDLVDWCTKNPEATRAIGTVELLTGLLLALNETERQFSLRQRPQITHDQRTIPPRRLAP